MLEGSWRWPASGPTCWSASARGPESLQDRRQRNRKARAQAPSGDRPGHPMCESNLGLFSRGSGQHRGHGRDAVGLGVYSVTPVRVLSVTYRGLMSGAAPTSSSVSECAAPPMPRAAACRRAPAPAPWLPTSSSATGCQSRCRCECAEFDKCIGSATKSAKRPASSATAPSACRSTAAGAGGALDLSTAATLRRSALHRSVRLRLHRPDAERRGRILEDSCIGCSLCALACPLRRHRDA